MAGILILVSFLSSQGTAIEWAHLDPLSLSLNVLELTTFISVFIEGNLGGGEKQKEETTNSLSSHHQELSVSAFVSASRSSVTYFSLILF